MQSILQLQPEPHALKAMEQKMADRVPQTHKSHISAQGTAELRGTREPNPLGHRAHLGPG